MKLRVDSLKRQKSLGRLIKEKKENIQINDIIYEKSNITIVKIGLKDNKIKIDKYLEILSFHVAVFAIKDYWEKM